MLEPYGSTLFNTPNFKRLATKTVTFKKHYIGSMPCMPARRDMQTGRLTFLHRSWGPIEPFDNSFLEILKQKKVYSHLISDHYHYWEDGGSTYHTRYNSFDFIRGQESDPWKVLLTSPIERIQEKYHHSQNNLNDKQNPYNYMINREFIKEEEDFHSVLCFNIGFE
ncbi:MAG: sulfatase-like hydrolase/transferase, partial [Pelagibacteraceae bacterium]